MIIEFPKVRRRAPLMQDQVLKSFSGITAAVSAMTAALQPGAAFAALMREERCRARLFNALMGPAWPKIETLFLIPPSGVLPLGTIAKIGEQT